MFAGGHDALRQVLALQSLNISNAEMTGKRGVLTEGFFDAPPARVASDIQDGRQPLLGANGAQLEADGSRHGLGQFGLEGGCQPQRLRIHAATQHHGARAALFMQDGGDAQASVLAQVLLQAVGGFGGGSGVQRGGAGDTRDLPDAIA